MLTPEAREGFNLSEGSSDAPGSCSYEDAIDGGDKVRVSIRTRTGRADAWPHRDDEAVVMVPGLGAPAVWITTNASGTNPPDRPGTTASTAKGTADRIGGRLLVSPPGYLVTVNVSGEYNNSRMAEDVAKLVLDGL